MGEWVSYPKFVSPATRTLHPDSIGAILKLLGGLSVGNSDTPLTGQIKLGSAAGSGYLTFYDGSYRDGYIDAATLYLQISGVTKATVGANGIAAGSFAPGAIVNADVSASAAIGATKIAAQPQVRAYNTGALPISGTTLTTLTFDSERFDTDTMHASGTPSRLTATTAGTYLIVASARWATNATGFRQLALLLNGSTYIASKEIQAATGAPTDMDITTIYQLTAGQYVEVQAAQGSGGSLNISVSGNFSPEFMMIRLST